MVGFRKRMQSCIHLCISPLSYKPLTNPGNIEVGEATAFAAGAGGVSVDGNSSSSYPLAIPSPSSASSGTSVAMAAALAASSWDSNSSIRNIDRNPQS